MLHMHGTGRTRTRVSRGRRFPLLPGIALCALAVVATGCGSVLAIAGYAAAASSIKSFLDDLDPDDPTYTLSGYVYIDNAADRIAVQADATLPTGGNWELYAEAPLSLDTTPPKTTTSNAQGFFQFTGIPQGENVHILTIGTPGGGQVQFTVRLDKPSITPL